jgi:hypothetical protein
MSGDLPQDGSYTSKAGFNAGFIGEYVLTDDFHLSLQPSFVRRGTGVAFDVGDLDPKDSLSITLDYLSLPLLARFLTTGGTWFVNGGVDLGFLLNASRHDITTGATVDVQSLLNDVDLMMLLGVGGVFPIDPAILSFELRYAQSLLNAGANDQLAAFVGVPPRFRSSGFSLLAAVLFPL